MGLGADVYGIVEVENTNYGAILDMALRLNQKTTERNYVAASAAVKGFSRIGDDVIRVDVLYDERRLELLDACYLNDDILQQKIDPTMTDPVFDGPSSNRYPLAVHFRIEDREFTVVVVHFKSKGPFNSSGSNADAGDGAGAWNARRLDASKAILKWIGSEYFCGSSESIALLGD